MNEIADLLAKLIIKVQFEKWRDGVEMVISGNSTFFANPAV